MPIIEIDRLTKDYGHGRGVFDISINVGKGECFGFLGPNGAGKTTTIRHLMGFSKPQMGKTRIMGKDSWTDAAELQKTIGYLPGEIALPTGITGAEFLTMMKKMRGLRDDRYCEMLLDKFKLDPNLETKAMSLGVKRKLAVVTAFMHDPDILILDEPTSGLDPIMQQIFIDHVLSEKKRGKTIFLSSHIFHEVDATCDQIAIIKDGKIVSQFVSDQLKQQSDKIYRVTLCDSPSYQRFVNLPYRFASKNPKKKRARVHVKDAEINSFISDISELAIADFQEFPFTLEDYFMQFYKEEKVFKGVQ
ncbi:ABC transporter ATP-binding protein [Eubacterium sp. 1001713B170207_170306_E7]|uniref:ABC transporter ATP-binding protein n=1 Tax=Eubacterium sp. 1001713B170207_170306_E7 TaxID=2787097 RepID=UPI001899E22A|nr:ABC transporter ATP-binding protein [Eubacterium sp. 1001713B170207_170306_E7]